MTRQGFLWSVGALLGIACTAAIAWSASLLAGQHIGLSSVPLSAAGRLAPPPGVPARRPRPLAPRHPTVRTRSTVATPPAAPAPSAVPAPAPAPVPAAPAAPASAASAPPAPAPSSAPREDAKPGGSSASGQRDD